ncbi:MAG: hypothetical protein DRJ49_05360 [Thermoprotei archaeon]|nr:MAG: hypothetical protein DRJ49_05360 [Thermoprotei archaeon]
MALVKRLSKAITVVAVVLFVILVISLIVVLYPLIYEIISRIYHRVPEGVKDEDKLLVLAKATELSTLALDNMSDIAHKSLGTMPCEEELEIISKYISISKYNINIFEEYLREDPMIPSMYRWRMLRTMSKYKRIVHTSERLSGIVLELYQTYKELRKAIETREYSKIPEITNRLENTENVLKEVLQNLNNISREDLLSGEHWRRVRRGLENTEKTLKEVYELKRLSQLLRDYPQLAELSFQIGRNMDDLIIALNRNDMNAVRRLVKSIRRCVNELISDEDFENYYDKVKELNPEYTSGLFSYVEYLKRGTPDPHLVNELMQLLDLLEKYTRGEITRDELIRRLRNLEEQTGIVGELSTGISRAYGMGSGATKGEERPRD